MSEAILPGPARIVRDDDLSPGLLAKVVEETSRQFVAHASRPSPVKLRSWEEIERFAEKAARSGMVPKDYIGKPDAICIAVQMGSELGLAPMQAVQNIAVINGRPSIWGDALPALCRASGVATYIKEWHEGDGDDAVFWCEAKRKDDPNPVRSSFSVADAKRANLWKTVAKIQKQGRDGQPYEVDAGPWYSYPQRMLAMRARGFCLRDAFPDVLKGLITAEEAMDIPFEETGLKVPSQPYKPTPATPVVEEPADPLREPNGTKWLRNLKSMLEAAMDMGEVLRISSHENVQKSLKEAPTLIKGQIKDLLADAYGRFDGAEEPRQEEAAT